MESSNKPQVVWVPLRTLLVGALLVGASLDEDVLSLVMVSVRLLGLVPRRRRSLRISLAIASPWHHWR